MLRTTSNRRDGTNLLFHTIQQKKVSITNREKEILNLISHEKSEKVISALLDISYHTVHSHKRNLFKKLGAKSAAGLVRKGFEQGILS